MRDTRDEILYFWFEETLPPQWFQYNPDFDETIRERFSVNYNMAVEGLCDNWKSNADGCLALCLLLDSFPRRMFRGDRRAYLSDKQALLVSKHALAKGFDQILSPIRRHFLYLPFAHSEDLRDVERGVELFQKIQKDDPQGYDYACRQRDLIERLGRYPERNVILGRQSSPEEEEYLAQKRAAF